MFPAAMQGQRLIMLLLPQQQQLMLFLRAHSQRDCGLPSVLHHKQYESVMNPHCVHQVSDVGVCCWFVTVWSGAVTLWKAMLAVAAACSFHVTEWHARLRPVCLGCI